MTTTTNSLPAVPLPLYVRLWICLTGWKAWRTRRKIDGAVCAMIREGINPDLAWELLKESNRQWEKAEEEFRHNATFGRHHNHNQTQPVGKESFFISK